VFASRPGHGDGEHSAVVALGTCSLGGAVFAIDREGQSEAGGAPCTFGVERLPASSWSTSELGQSASADPDAAWLESASGDALCAPVSGEGHDQHWHFTLTADGHAHAPAVFVLQAGGATARVALCSGAAPSHGGILTPLRMTRGDSAKLSGTAGAEVAGFLELKLHDDLGDLEAWLTLTSNGQDQAAGRPLDLPAASAQLTATFHAPAAHQGRAVHLRVRNGNRNEDEGGNANMRPGQVTNYFIFPGGASDETKGAGAAAADDALWLTGESWRGLVSFVFDDEASGAAYACDPFVLVPHSAL
jgi:hypothetical protein